MSFRSLVILGFGISLLIFFGLACCCPIAFPVGNRPDTIGSSSSKIAVPSLKIIYPTNGTFTGSSQIDVKGLTDSNAKLTVNGKNIEVSYDGTFSGFIDLAAGENTLVFEAIKPGGDPNIQEIEVTSSAST